MPKRRDGQDFSVAIIGAGKRVILRYGQHQLSLRGKGVQFVLALITTQYPKYFSRDELHLLSDWKAMSAASVGKQAARLVDTINQKLSPIIEWELKTNAWRLQRNIVEILAAETVAEARHVLSKESWSSILRFSGAPADKMASWVRLCGQALVEMTQGRAEEGYLALRRASETMEHEGIAGITDVLATRLGQALPNPHLPVPGSAPPSTFMEAAEARRLAAYARMTPSAEWPYQFDLLHRSLVRMIEIGDTATQAILFNALAVLARRMERLDEAIDCIKEAAALALFTGDIILIQNISFNFGNILNDLSDLRPELFHRDNALELIQLDIELRKRLKLGLDSAQAELLYAYLELESGHYESVEALLESAREIIAVSQQPYDLALYERIKGQLLCDTSLARSPQRDDGIAALERSLSLYSQYGNTVASEAVQRELERRRE